MYQFACFIILLINTSNDKANILKQWNINDDFLIVKTSKTYRPSFVYLRVVEAHFWFGLFITVKLENSPIQNVYPKKKNGDPDNL